MQHSKLCCSLHREDLGSTYLVLASRSKWLLNLHSLNPLVIRGGGLAQARACSPGLSERGRIDVQRDWQCSHLSEQSRCEPQGTGQHSVCVKISEAR